MLPQFKFAPYIQPFVGGLSEEAGQAVKQRLAQYYQAQDDADAIGYAANQLKYQTLPNDQLAVNNITKSYNDKLQEYVNKGDYENLGRAIKMDARRFSNDITPLLQRKAQYQDYVKEINSNKNLSEETKKLAIRKSMETDRGYNPEDINTHTFAGYVPNNDVNIADVIDKYTENFKGDGKEYEIKDFITGVTTKVKSSTNEAPILYNKNGKNVPLFFDETTNQFNLDQIGRPTNQIEYAARAYAQGNTDISNYAQSQAYLTGSNEKVNRELNTAISAALKKAGYTDTSRTTDISIPTSYDYMNKIADNNRQLETTTAGYIPNTTVTDMFDGSKINSTGDIQNDTDLLEANPDGSFNKFVDDKGNILSLNEVENIRKGKNTPLGGGISDKKFTVVKVPKEEVTKIRDVQNKNLDELVKLAALSQAGLEYPQQGQNAYQHQFAKTNYLIINEKKLKDPNFRKQVFKAYKQDIDFNKNIEVPKVIADNKTGIKVFGEGDNIIGNIGNRVVHINQSNNELGLTPSSLEGANDYKTLLEKLPEGWEVETMTGSDILFGNPQGTNPAAQVMLTLKNKESGKKTTLNISTELNPIDNNFAALQKINEIYRKSISGSGGEVSLPGAGKVKITSIPLSVTGEGKGFKTIVQQLNQDGVAVGDAQPYIGFINKLYQGLKTNNIINPPTKK